MRALATLLVQLVAAKPPHIFTFIVDDLGWGNVGWHRADAGLPPTTEVQTPNLDVLARGGIDLSRHYGFKSCSPSRCSFQSGRLPVHVPDANQIPEVGSGRPQGCSSQPPQWLARLVAAT